MTGKTAVAIVSAAVAVASFGCLSFYEIPVETPIQAKIDVSAFQRVLVAGFLAGGSNDIDANTETARLLRSQLRTKSDMKVIDSDVLALVDEVDRRQGTAVAPASAAADQPKAADQSKIKDDKDLEPYQAIFDDQAYWKKMGEEYQSPLIVTGSVMFTEIAKSGIQSTPREYIDATGQRHVEEVRQWTDRKGFALVPTFVFIDGRTGAQLYNETFHEETYYPSSQNTPPLSSYFELMDRLLPGFLNTLSTQKIKGTRILIK